MDQTAKGLLSQIGPQLRSNEVAYAGRALEWKRNTNTSSRRRSGPENMA